MPTGVDGIWATVVGSRAGTQNVEWARTELAGGADYGSVESDIRDIPVGCEGVRYLPYLSASGEDGTFVDPDARAHFVGLEPSHSTAHLVRAVYEGVAYALRDCYEQIPVESSGRVYLSGGGARSVFWTQMFADCLDTEVIVPEDNELGAKGAALLAGLAVNVYSSMSEAVERTTTIARSHQPRPNYTTRYERLYDLFVRIVEEVGEVWAANQHVQENLDDSRN